MEGSVGIGVASTLVLAGAGLVDRSDTLGASVVEGALVEGSVGSGVLVTSVLAAGVSVTSVLDGEALVEGSVAADISLVSMIDGEIIGESVGTNVSVTPGLVGALIEPELSCVSLLEGASVAGSNGAGVSVLEGASVVGSNGAGVSILDGALDGGSNGAGVPDAAELEGAFVKGSVAVGVSKIPLDEDPSIDETPQDEVSVISPLEDGVILVQVLPS